jgi:hypothetical protein
MTPSSLCDSEILCEGLLLAARLRSVMYLDNDAVLVWSGIGLEVSEALPTIQIMHNQTIDYPPYLQARPLTGKRCVMRRFTVYGKIPGVR